MRGGQPTKSRPDRTSLELATPSCGEKSYSARHCVFVDNQGVPETIIIDSPSRSLVKNSGHGKEKAYAWKSLFSPTGVQESGSTDTHRLSRTFSTNTQQ